MSGDSTVEDIVKKAKKPEHLNFPEKSEVKEVLAELGQKLSARGFDLAGKAS